MAILYTLRGPNLGRRFPLEGTSWVVGRTPDAAIYLESTAVSRQHAQLVLENGTFFVEDLGSSNGTYVNGKRIHQRSSLGDKDMLQIGPYQFSLREEAPSAAPTMDNGLVIREQVQATPTNQSLYSLNPAYKLQVVLEISQLLSRTLEIEPLLDKLLDHLLSLFPQAERGIVLLKEGDELFMRGQRCRLPDGRTDLSFSRTIVERALEEGIGIRSEDAQADRRFLGSQTIMNLNLRSLLCVPLIGSNGRRIGVIQLDRVRLGRAFSSEDLELLTAVALQVAVVLENAALHDELLREERLRQELALAREIQEGFLPTNFQPLGESTFELFARVQPARQVSGDLYDFFPLTDGRLAFFFGDVSGKGMPAALFMVAVRTLSRHLASVGGSPAETLRKLNTALSADNPSAMFVTLIHGLYDAKNGTVVLASAGHPRPLLRRLDGTVEELELLSGRLLGYGEGNLNLSDMSVTLQPGETLILYTDGFIEARAPDRSVFGLERLKATLGGDSQPLTLQECAEKTRQAVEHFIGDSEQQDDLTLLLLRRVT
jgi:serine phosphatase RsbU (regulator of sigma subunit)